MRRYGPPYDPQKPLEAQLDWEEHRIFMNALEAEGLARLGGPLEGTTEVLLVFRAESEDEIDAASPGRPMDPIRHPLHHADRTLELAHR